MSEIARSLVGTSRLRPGPARRLRRGVRSVSSASVSHRPQHPRLQHVRLGRRWLGLRRWPIATSHRPPRRARPRCGGDPRRPSTARYQVAGSPPSSRLSVARICSQAPITRCACDGDDRDADLGQSLLVRRASRPRATDAIIEAEMRPSAACAMTVGISSTASATVQRRRRGGDAEPAPHRQPVGHRLVADPSPGLEPVHLGQQRSEASLLRVDATRGLDDVGGELLDGLDARRMNGQRARFDERRGASARLVHSHTHITLIEHMFDQFENFRSRGRPSGAT